MILKNKKTSSDWKKNTNKYASGIKICSFYGAACDGTAGLGQADGTFNVKNVNEHLAHNFHLHN